MSRVINSASVFLLDSLVYAGMSCAGALRTGAARFRRSTAGTFLQEFVAQPRTVGAIWPSSSNLARHMAKCTSTSGAGLVVELGAGTGVVTHALLDRGIPASRLRVVECSAVFARHLRQRYPRVNVIEGDAAVLWSLLQENALVTTIVSSLPLRSLSNETVAAIVEQWRKVLPLGGRVVQFTYALTGKTTEPLHGFIECESRIIWGNLPPARVTVFIRTA